jgi:uncharacterized membrane protein YfcA
VTLAVVVLAGAVIGLSLGALGGGGSILAVPVLVYGLGQSAAQATTGSLLVVGVTALVGAITAYRSGHVLLTRGIAFGSVAIAGAAVGAMASALVPEPVLLAAFAALLVVVAGAMSARQVRSRRGQSAAHLESRVGDPIIAFRPSFACHCPRALKVLGTATVVGLLTGFLGVGGGFLVVPALVMALGLPMSYAAGTSLVVITITSASALAIRAGTGAHPSWGVVALLTAVAVAGGWAGARLTARTDTRKLQAAFTVLLLLVAGYTAARAGPTLALPDSQPAAPQPIRRTHDVPSRELQEVRQDHLGRMWPAREAGAGRRPGIAALRGPR